MVDERIQRLLPDYMTMGTEGMADMATMGMGVPPNSIPMVGGQGPFDYITMGGMFTILKVRDQLADGEDEGWYKNPPETVAATASNADLRADGTTIPRPTRHAERRGPGHAGHRNLSR